VLLSQCAVPRIQMYCEYLKEITHYKNSEVNGTLQLIFSFINYSQTVKLYGCDSASVPEANTCKVKGIQNM
jgi:hypothetical protein